MSLAVGGRETQLSVLQAAIIRHRSLGGFKNRYLFLTVLEAGKSNIKVLPYLVPGESLLGLQTATLLSVYSCEGEKELSSLFSYVNTNPIMGSPPSWHHLSLILSKAPPVNTITLGFRASIYEFSWKTNIQFMLRTLKKNSET
uniref:Uncharacterized protein n=1 Tax=Rousettus aegyptiacus TaxID=9407 RepID=A0A7J8HR55_ROUAE|nr:hypothetical protein HJG63_010979 [Rousettus aegyptiacus]